MSARKSERECTPQEKLCVQTYIKTGSMSDAFRAAYPKSKLTGDALNASAKKVFRRTPVRLLLGELQKRQEKRFELSAARVLGELHHIGFADIRDVIDWGGTVCVKDAETGEIRTINSVVIKSAKDITPEAAAAIASIEQTKDGAIKIKFHDKRAALVDLGKHLGIFKADNEQAGKAAAEAAAAAAQNPRDIARAVLAVIQEANKVQGKDQKGKS